MEPIIDTSNASQMLSLVEAALGARGIISPDWIAARGWEAVPVEGAMHFNEDDAASISRAVRQAGCRLCFAVAAEPVADGMSVMYTVAATPDDLLAFSRSCAHFEYALVTEDIRFLILCTVQDYYIVAGTRDFVAAAVGGSVSEARRKFWEFATLADWPDAVRDHLVSVYEKYTPR